SFFFFQAEDGIRDRNVTGVQTCALPILATNSPLCGVVYNLRSQAWSASPAPWCAKLTMPGCAGCTPRHTAASWLPWTRVAGCIAADYVISSSAATRTAVRRGVTHLFGISTTPCHTGTVVRQATPTGRGCVRHATTPKNIPAGNTG